jgi:galactose mutarotase-like enzyme
VKRAPDARSYTDAMTARRFGSMPDGSEVLAVTIGRQPGPVLELLTLGATTHRLEVNAGDGQRRNVVLGQATAAERLSSGAYLGGTIGRYANRIAGGRFTLDGIRCQVQTNDRGNSLHGGPIGFDKRIWEVDDHGVDHAALSLVSPAGDMGFPGALDVRVTYEVDGPVVRVTQEATADEVTVVSLTNHAYFNLDGDGSGCVDAQLLTVDADEFTPVDATGVPLGAHAPVAGTPFDFRQPVRIGSAARARHEQVELAGGIDHNFVIRDAGLRRSAALESSSTRTRLEVWADHPGLQVYTGNALDGSQRSSDGIAYRQGDGIALEPQLYPDSPNHPEWPSARLAPGDRYHARLEWRFSTT